MNLSNLTSVKPKSDLFRRTKTEAPARERSERKAETCREHPGIALWKQERNGVIKILNPICPLCAITFCRQIKAGDSTAIENEAEEFDKLANHYAKLGATLEDQSENIEVLSEEFKRIKSKLVKGIAPRDAINRRRVTHAIEDAMEAVAKRCDEREPVVGANHVDTLPQVRALYSNIEQVKKMLVEFGKKSENAKELANQVLQQTLHKLNRLAEQLDDQTSEWGDDIKEVREDLEYARAHIGSLQVALREARVELSIEVKTAIRTFGKRSVLLEDRMDKFKVPIPQTEMERMETMKRLVAELERSPRRDWSEIEGLVERQRRLRQQAPSKHVSSIGSSPKSRRSLPQIAPSPPLVVASPDSFHTAISPKVTTSPFIPISPSSSSSNSGSPVAADVEDAIVNLLHFSRAKKTSTVEIVAALERLRVLAKGNPQRRGEIVSANGVEAILGAMKQNLRNEDVQVMGCITLCNLAIDDNNIEIVKLDGMSTILSAMEQFHTSENVQWSGCAAVGNLANDEHSKIEIAKLDGISTILSAMQEFRASEYVQEYGCSALETLAVSDNNRAEIAKLDGIRIILSAMQQFRKNEKVQCHGCGALGNLVSKNNNNKLEIARLDGISTILAAMQQFRTSENVQYHGCGALGNLANHDENNRVEVARLYGVLTILSAMELFRKSKKVQVCGCGALRNLAANDDNRIEIAKLNGIPTILSTLQQFPRSERVQDTGCGALAILALNGNNRQVIIENGGRDLAETAKRNHGRSQRVQDVATVLLDQLALP